MAAVTNAPVKISSQFRTHFTGLVSELLAQLVYSFEDCASTRETRDAFEAHIKGNLRNEVSMLENWHRVMSPHYREMVQDPLNAFDEVLDVLMKVAERTDNVSVNDLMGKMMIAKMTSDEPEFERCRALMHDPVYFLKRLDLQKKWRDPLFDDESRRYIVCYMLHLNGFAILHAIVSDDLFDIAQIQGNKLMKSMAAPQPGGKFDVLAMTREIHSSIPKELSQPFLDNMPTFAIAISSLGGAGLEGGNMLMNILQSSGSMSEQMEPMRKLLEIALPMVSKIPPDAFQNLAPLVHNLMAAADAPGGIPDLDPGILQHMLQPDTIAFMLKHIQTSRQ